MSAETQSNIQPGDTLTLEAGGTITEGYICKLHTDGTVIPIAAKNDTGVLFLALEDGVSGGNVALKRLHPGTEIRIKTSTVSGTQNAGVIVYLAASADGKIDENSSSATAIGRALETFTTGKLVRVQPFAQGA